MADAYAIRYLWCRLFIEAHLQTIVTIMCGTDKAHIVECTTSGASKKTHEMRRCRPTDRFALVPAQELHLRIP